LCFFLVVALQGWEDIVLKQEEESGTEVEMKLSLPAMPSPYAVSVLFAGCQEIYRVGGHILDRAVLKHFAWNLCQKVGLCPILHYKKLPISFSAPDKLKP
jgi:hypothetical protein